MNKKSIIIVALIILLTISIVSLYSSFAYNEESAKLDESTANYNLIYSLKEQSNRQLSVASKEEIYVDITLTNTYQSTVKYGMYYYLINPIKMPDGISISLAEDSADLLENTINAGETRVVSLRITNNSDYNIDLIVGALVGFENGNIADLVQNGEVLIK